MVIESSEAERISQGDAAERINLHSVFCGFCGYNLKHGAVIGRCTECGRAYNARPMVMKGIFQPHAHSFPLVWLLQTCVALPMGIWIILGAVSPVNDWLLILGTITAWLGLMSGATAIRRLRLFIRAVRVHYRVEREEDE
ncbi:MAG: hypothetical protein HOP29_00445 [Phycisphaerales bacterium]|nr:hypothetical protein [Phycisphaerales bacterium]